MSRIGLGLLLSSLALSGCGISHVASPATTTGTLGAVRGLVHGGRQPVAGAHVYLLQVGSTGNGGKDIAASSGNASISLLTSAGTNTLFDGSNYYVQTDSKGGFSISGDYTCTSGTQLYLYAIGGDAGAGTNSHAAFMEGLGACPAGASTLPANSYFWMDEVTTVATAYAMSGYATDATHIAANLTYTGNPQAQVASQGMLNAMANVPNMVNVATGTALSITPGDNGAVPQAQLNTLANILAACVNSSDAAPGACSVLFNNTLSDGATGTTPTDTATAAIYLAHNPAASAAALYALQSSSSPFTPNLAAAPNDFSLAITFGGGGLSFPRSLAVDGAGNVWAVSLNSLVNLFSPQGVPVSATGLTTSTTTPLNAVTIDNNGNAWAQDNNGAYTGFSASGARIGSSSASGSGATGGTSDSFGYLWSANATNGSVTRFDPIAMTTVSSTSVERGAQIAADSAGNIWLASVTGNLDKVNQVGALQTTYSNVFTNPTAMAVDASNAVYVEDASRQQLVRVGSDGTKSTFSDGVSGGYTMALDGQNTVWTATNLVAAHTSAGVAIPSQSVALPAGTKTSSIAIDPSGNLWAADSYENNTQIGSHLTEFIGLAAPTVTPLSYAATHGTLQNALNLTVGFNGVQTQFPYETQFYNAQSAYYSSIGETFPSGARYCHAYMSWDAGLQPVGSGPLGTEGSRAWFENWLGTAQGNCDRAMVSFKVINGVTSNTTSFPTTAQYQAAVQAFVAINWSYTGWTGVIDYTPWNEPQNGAGTGDGISGSPIAAQQAADYYLALRQACAPPQCEVAAGDFGSNGQHYVDFIQQCTDDTAALCASASYMDQYKHYIVTDAPSFGFASTFRPEFWAYHGWDDINNYINGTSHCTDSQKCTIRALYTALSDSSWANSEIWDTEVAAGQNPQAEPANQYVQACAASYLLDLTATTSARFTRLYWTQLYYAPGDYFSMFNTDGSIKPSFTVMTQRNIAYAPPSGYTCP